MSVFSTSSDHTRPVGTAPGTNKQTVYKCPKCGWEIKSHLDLSGKPCLNCDGKVEEK